MVRERKIIFLALFLALITFLLGFLFSNWIYTVKFEEYRIFSENLLASLIGLETIKQMELDLCNLSEADLIESKVKLGKMLTALESRKGKSNVEVLSLKEIYEIIEIKTLMFLEEFEEKCQKKFNLILFFYSNFKNYTLSMDQGVILDTLVNEFEKQGKKIYVFSFSFETTNPASKFLRKIYNITQVPSLVINEKIFKGFQNKNKIKKFLVN